METEELTCGNGTGDAACKRLKNSKKSYKDTSKFTINSLLSKPDRPHKTPAPHVNCKINKKAHTVFSFNDSPEKLIKIKSPHMLTAEVKKLYSPPSLENCRFLGSGTGSREGLNLSKEGKYKPSSTMYTTSRPPPPPPTTVSSNFRPTTAQLLYQRQLSKQDCRIGVKDRSDVMTDGNFDFDSDSDPFKFTPSSNGHSPAKSSYPAEFDKFAYHSPEHAPHYEIDTKLSEEKSKIGSHGFTEFKSDSPSLERTKCSETNSLSLTRGPIPTPHLSHVKQGSTEKIARTDRSKTLSTDTDEKPQSPMLSYSVPPLSEIKLPVSPSPLITSTPSINPALSASTISSPSPDVGSSVTSISQSSCYPVLTSSQDSAPLAPSLTSLAPSTKTDVDADKAQSSDQPASKLYRGKLSFFKQAISQEISTMQEIERLAKAQQELVKSTAPAPSEAVPLKRLSEDSGHVEESKCRDSSASPSKSLKSSEPLPGNKPVRNSLSPEKQPVDLPTNVVRKAIKRPITAQIIHSSHLLSHKHPGSKGGASSTKKQPRVVHSINANPIPVVMNGHKVSVVKIEKHQTPPMRQVSQRDTPVYKVSGEQQVMSPSQQNAYPIAFADYLKVQQQKQVWKRKFSSESPSNEVPSKKQSRGHIVSPTHKITFSASPTKTTSVGSTSEIVKVDHSVLSKNLHVEVSPTGSKMIDNKSSNVPTSLKHVTQIVCTQVPSKSPGINKKTGQKHLVKCHKNNSHHSISKAKRTLQSKILSQTEPRPAHSKVVPKPEMIVNQASLRSPKKPIIIHHGAGISGDGAGVSSNSPKSFKLSISPTKVSSNVAPTSLSSLITCDYRPVFQKDLVNPAPMTIKREPVPEQENASQSRGLSVNQEPEIKREQPMACSPILKTEGIATPHLSVLSDPRNYISVESCPDGDATVVRLEMERFEELNVHQQNLVVDHFFELTFGETNGVADHVMGIISNGAYEIPNVLNFLVDNAPGLKINHQVLGKKDIMNCTIGEYYEKIKRNHSKFIYHEGGMQHVSLVGTKSEESGSYFPELVQLMELNPFFNVTLPWGTLSRYHGLEPSLSNDGPIFWVRPGEQFLQSTSGSRNHKGYRLLKNRETLVIDRTTPHADHSWEDGKTMMTTAAAAFLQPVQIRGEEAGLAEKTVKDVIAFDAANFYQLAEELQLDLYEPPMTQCDIWIEDAKLNQLRESGVKYSRIRLKANDIYFIPRNVIHQFKTVAACLSVAWHVRLKQYYDS